MKRLFVYWWHLEPLSSAMILRKAVLCNSFLFLSRIVEFLEWMLWFNGLSTLFYYKVSNWWFFFQIKTDPAELEEISPVTAMVLSQEMYKGQNGRHSSVVTTSVATTPLSMSWMTSEPVQWSRLRMTYSFEYFIMKQYGKVLL